MSAENPEEIDDILESENDSDSSSEEETDEDYEKEEDATYDMRKLKWLWFEDLQIRFGWTVTSYFVLIKLMILFFAMYGGLSLVRFIFYIISFNDCELLFTYDELNYTTDPAVILQYYQPKVDACLFITDTSVQELQNVFDSRDIAFEQEWYRCLSAGFASVPFHWYHTVVIFLIFVLVIFFLQIGFPRYQAQAMRKCARYLPSVGDFTLLVSGFPECDTNPDELQAFFVNLGFGVHSVNMIPRNRRFFNLVYQRAILESNLYVEKRRKSVLHILSCIAFFNSCILDNFKTLENAWVIAFGNIYELRQRLSVMNKIIEEMEDKKLKWNRKAFVTFNTFEDAAFCMEYFNKHRIVRFLKIIPFRFVKPKKRLLFDRRYILHVRKAPEPQDILWQNLGVKVYERTIRKTMAIVACIYVLICFYIWEATLQNTVYRFEPGKDFFLFMNTKLGQSLLSLMLAILENIIEMTLETVSTFVKHHTNSETQHARVFWFTIMRVSTVFILMTLSLNYEYLTWKCYFHHASGIFHQMMFFSIFTSTPIFPLLRFIFAAIFFFPRKLFKRNWKVSFKNATLHRSEFRYAKNVSFILSRYIVFLGYGVVFPASVVFMSVTIFLYYILERINFSFFYRPDKLRMNRIPTYYLYFFFGFFAFCFSLITSVGTLTERLAEIKNSTTGATSDVLVDYYGSTVQKAFETKKDPLIESYTWTGIIVGLIFIGFIIYLFSWGVLLLIKLIRCEPFAKTRHTERFLRTRKKIRKRVKKQYKKEIKGKLEPDEEIEELVYDEKVHGGYEIPFNAWTSEQPVQAPEEKRDQVRLEVMMTKKNWKKLSKSRSKLDVLGVAPAAEGEDLEMAELEYAPPMSPNVPPPAIELEIMSVPDPIMDINLPLPPTVGPDEIVPTAPL